jgi:hypothetical protein
MEMTLTQSQSFQFWWGNFEKQLDGLISCHGRCFDGPLPLRVEKGVQSIFVAIGETAQYGYLGAKRTVLDFLSITLANSFTGPYIMQPAWQCFTQAGGIPSFVLSTHKLQRSVGNGM